jgi:hypothetical protein
VIYVTLAEARPQLDAGISAPAAAGRGSILICGDLEDTVQSWVRSLAGALALLIVAGTARPAEAQEAPSFEFGVGYQALHVPDQWLPVGINLDFAWNASDVFGLVGEIGWGQKSEEVFGVDIDLRATNFGVGPRFNLRGNVVQPFAQFLVGAIRGTVGTSVAGIDIDVSDTFFMIQPGGGVNVAISESVGIVGHVDYRRVFVDDDLGDSTWENEFRFVVGVRFGF